MALQPAPPHQRQISAPLHDKVLRRKRPEQRKRLLFSCQWGRKSSAHKSYGSHGSSLKGKGETELLQRHRLQQPPSPINTRGEREEEEGEGGQEATVPAHPPPVPSAEGTALHGHGNCVPEVSADFAEAEGVAACTCSAQTCARGVAPWLSFRVSPPPDCCVLLEEQSWTAIITWTPPHHPHPHLTLHKGHSSLQPFIHLYRGPPR